MKRYISIVLTTLFCLASLAATATQQPGGIITFVGQIVDIPPGQALAQVTPVTTVVGNRQETVYAVSSTVTNRTLATFSTAAAANTFAVQVTPSVAVSQ
jgi:hypothetical protein